MMQKAVTGRSTLFEQCCFALLAACLHVLVYGYQFNSGDQSEHLPQVYQALDPALYPHDFFLSYYHQTFTVRFCWVETVTFLSHFLPVPVVCFGLFMLCTMLSALAWIRIAACFTDNRFAQYITPLLVFLLLNTFTVGGNQLAGVMFVSSNVAETCVSFAILCFLRSRYPAAALLLAAGSLFQVLIGFQLWLLLSAALFFSARPDRFLQLLYFSLLYLAASMPVLWPLFGRQFFAHEVYDHALYYRILYVYRGMMHFRPSLFPLADYIKTLIVVLPAVYLLYKQPWPQQRMLRTFFITLIAGAVAYTILIEIFRIDATGKIQWFKTTVWLNAFSCVLMAAWLAERIKHAAWLSTLLQARVTLAASVLLLVMLCNSVWLPARVAHRYQTGRFAKTDLQLAHEWIREHTPKDAMFLAPPEDDAFACEAQRPQPVNYKAVVHEPFYMMEWYQRMQAYYHVDFDSLDNTTALAQASERYKKVLSYPAQNEAQYRIDNAGESNVIPQLGPVLHRQGSWIVSRVKTGKHD